MEGGEFGRKGSEGGTWAGIGKEGRGQKRHFPRSLNDSNAPFRWARAWGLTCLLRMDLEI